MKISELSDEDLSRWIAEKLDPKHLPGRGVWYVAMYNSIRHHDMVNDPAMTDLLWKKLIHELDLLTAAEKVCKTPVALNNGTSDVWNRAVAEAFALSQGWSEQVQP